MNPILIVDDEAAIAMLVRRILTEAGYRCQAVTDSRAAADLLEKNRYDLVLLDVMMPHLDGYDLLAYLRPTGTPCIFITAKDAVAERVRGLNSGADDYIVKPFSPGEVMARIRAVLRRIPAAAEKEMLVIGELSIHLPSLSVTLSGHKLNLTRREVELLYTLAASPGRVFTRDNLLTIVWGYEFAGNYRAVDSHIKRLRAKLDAYPHDTFTIATVWGAGYKFERNLP